MGAQLSFIHPCFHDSRDKGTSLESRLCSRKWKICPWPKRDTEITGRGQLGQRWCRFPEGQESKSPLLAANGARAPPQVGVTAQHSCLDGSLRQPSLRVAKSGPAKEFSFFLLLTNEPVRALRSQISLDTWAKS